jgi:alkaline phosphatase D
MSRRLVLLALAPLLIVPITSAADEPEAPRSRIVFASNLAPIHVTSFNAIQELDPDLVLLGGDTFRSVPATPEAMLKAYGELRNWTELRRFKSSRPVLATWSEEDAGKTPAQVQEAYLSLWDIDVKTDHPGASRKGVYRSRSFGPEGKNVHVMLLDTRTHRSNLDRTRSGEFEHNYDQTTTLLGEEQWRWLETELKKPARIRIVVSATPILECDERHLEGWGQFPHERERFLRAVRDARADGVIVVSGERHRSGIAAVDAGLGYPVYDLTSCMVETGGGAPRDGSRQRIPVIGQRTTTALVLVDWKRTDPSIRLQLRDGEGDILLQEKTTLSALSAKKSAAAPGEGRDFTATAAADEADGSLKVDGKAMTSKQVGEMVGKTITLDMKVAVVGKNKTGSMLFLNNVANFKSPDNFTVAINKKGIDGLKAAGIADPMKTFAGKTVRIVGEVVSFQDRHEILVSDAAKIKLVDKE